MSAFTWPPELPAEAPAAVAAAARAVRGEPVQAAVLVPLLLPGPAAEEPMEPHLVLTRRRKDLRRHAGEISFPGGRRDSADATLTDTALREAEEEIGLRRESVSLIGGLPPTSTLATNYMIHPFVGTLPERVAWRISAKEVDVVLELPLAELRASRTKTQLERRGFSFTTDAFILDGNVIWGATARIIDELLARLEVGAEGGELALKEGDRR